MCHLYPYFYGSFFFTLIFAVLLVVAIFLYETRVLDNSYLQFKFKFKFKLPTSDSTQITAGGPKVPIEGFVLIEAP